MTQVRSGWSSRVADLMRAVAGGGALSSPGFLPGTETMSVDSSLPSPNQLSSPSMGFDGLPGRRRKKRTSIETNVRFALEKSFLAVRPPTSSLAGQRVAGGKASASEPSAHRTRSLPQRRSC